VNRLASTLTTRLVPALLTAAGVTLVAAGLLSISNPVTAGPVDDPETTLPPLVLPTPVSFPPVPTATPAPSGSPSPPAVDRLATRVVVRGLDIDMPVIAQPDPSYPACNVAMYISGLASPGAGRATYLYAHARPGMFEPLLKTKSGQLRGQVVEIYTSDNLKFLYEITEVRRNQFDLDDALKATTEQLWLQTSEGPRGSGRGKTQVIAMPLSWEPATPAEAHPKARPVDCS
jgi:hypothetical protein